MRSFPLKRAQAPQRLRCPLPVAAIGGFFALSILFSFAFLLLHMPLPVILFGHRLNGTFGPAPWAGNPLPRLVTKVTQYCALAHTTLSLSLLLFLPVLFLLGRLLAVRRPFHFEPVPPILEGSRSSP